MKFKVYWTKSGKNNLKSIVKYLQLKWSIPVAKSFISKVRDFTEIISEFPKLGSLEVPEKGIRGFQIAKQIRVFYRIKAHTHRIIILALFDSRQNPDKKPS